MKLAAYLTIIAHLLLVILHAAAHQTLGVDATAMQLSFIFTVIMIAPVVAGLLLWKFERTGSLILALSMAGSFAFGAYNHFVGHSIDHVTEVAHLQPAIWSTIFQLTALGLALSEAAGTFLGAWLLFIRQQDVETNAA